MPVERQRAIDVGRILHVDPELAAGFDRLLRQAFEVAEADFVRAVQTELSRFHRHHDRQSVAPNPIVGAEVVVAHVVRPALARERLAKPGDDAPDSRVGQLARGAQRILESLPRHESRDGASRKGAAHELLGQPPAPRGPQEHVPRD